MSMDEYSERREHLELLGYEEDTTNGLFEQLLYQEFGEEITFDQKLGEQLYASIVKVIWSNAELKKIYSCSWRYAGGLVADIRNSFVLRAFKSDSKGKEDYMDFYCSGGEGKVIGWIGARLRAKGWDFVEGGKEILMISLKPPENSEEDD